MAIARDLGRALGPMLYKRMDPATAGTVGFLIRLGAGVVAIIFALSIAGLKLETLLAAAAFTAVIIGLAAQQTLGNVIAGLVLLSARPFRVGDRVRLQAGPLAGQLEGTVASLGLLYTELAEGEDTIMVPNSVVLNSSVTPLREPDRVEFLARSDARASSRASCRSCCTRRSRSDPLRARHRAARARRRGDGRPHLRGTEEPVRRIQARRRDPRGRRGADPRQRFRLRRRDAGDHARERVPPARPRCGPAATD